MTFYDAIKLLRFKYPKGDIRIEGSHFEPEDRHEERPDSKVVVTLFGYGKRAEGDDLDTVVRRDLLGQHD